MKKMFKIGMYEEIGGYAIIFANNKKEARELARQILEDEGLKGFDNAENCLDTTHREVNVFEVEEEK